MAETHVTPDDQNAQPPQDSNPGPHVLDRFQATQMSLMNGPGVGFGAGAEGTLGLLGNQTAAQRAATRSIVPATAEAAARQKAFGADDFDKTSTDTSGIAANKFDSSKDFLSDYSADDPTSQARADTGVAGAQSEAEANLGKSVGDATTHLQDVFKTKTDTLRKYSDGYNDWLLGLPTSVGTLGAANGAEIDSLTANQALAQGTGGNVGAGAALGYNLSALDAAQLGGQIQQFRGQAQQNLNAYDQANSAQQSALSQYQQSLTDAGTSEGKFVDARTQALADARDTGTAAINTAQTAASAGITKDATAAKSKVDAELLNRYNAQQTAQGETDTANKDGANYDTLKAQYDALPDYLKQSKTGKDFLAALGSKQTRDTTASDNAALYKSVGYDPQSGTFGDDVSGTALIQASKSAAYKSDPTFAAAVQVALNNENFKTQQGFQKLGSAGKQLDASADVTNNIASAIRTWKNDQNGAPSQQQSDEAAKYLSAVPPEYQNSPQYKAAMQAYADFQARFKQYKVQQDNKSYSVSRGKSF